VRALGAGPPNGFGNPCDAPSNVGLRLAGEFKSHAAAEAKTQLATADSDHGTAECRQSQSLEAGRWSRMAAVYGDRFKTNFGMFEVVERDGRWHRIAPAGPV
jgi:hypothetical protein